MPRCGNIADAAGRLAASSACNLAAKVGVVVLDGDGAGGAPFDDSERPHGGVETEAAIVDTLLASAPVGFALFDTELRFRRINERLAELNGLSVEAHIGEFAFDLLPDLRDSAEAMMRGVIETGIAVRDREIVGRTPAEPDRDRHWLESFFPVITRNGVRVGLAAVVTDITDRVRLQQELQETVSVLEAMLRAAPMSIAVTDADRRILRANDAFADFAGTSAAALIGFRVEEVIEGDFGRQVADAANEAMRTGLPVDATQMERARHDLGLQELIGHFFPVPGDDDSLTGVGMAVLDVTERNRAERNAKARLRQRVDAQAEALAAIQVALLPDLPQPPELSLDACYSPAASHAAVGGDWYDGFALPDGRVVLAVGDAVGHGLSAVRTMDAARNAIRTLLLTGRPLGEAMTDCNTVLHRTGPDYATVSVVVFDPATGSIEYVNAGHPPPLLRRTNGAVELLDAAQGTVLGPVAKSSYGTAKTALGRGETLVLYTDGLVERRDEHLDTGIARLASLVAAIAGDGPGLAQSLVDDALHLSEPDHHDDICLLIATSR
jgi:PAS domain S-box-containing protein